MNRLGVVLLPLGSIVGDDFADGHGMGDDVTDESLETVDNLWDPRVRFASVVPPLADALCLLLQGLNYLRRSNLRIKLKIGVPLVNSEGSNLGAVDLESCFLFSQ